MLLELLILIIIPLFIIFFIKLGKEWYAPYTLFVVPFIVMFIVALLHKTSWELNLNVKTFLVFLIGIFFFLAGCWVAKNVVFSKDVAVKHNIVLYPTRGNLNSIRLLFVDAIMLIFFTYFLYLIYSYGKANKMGLTEAINYIMINSKFSIKDTLVVPFIVQIFLQINYLAAYLYSFFIARRIIKKDGSSLFLLLVGYGLSMATCFLNGSRGPLVENLVALILAVAITWRQKYGMKMFPRKILAGILVGLVVAAIGFFAMLPLLGREATAESIGDSITEYIGSQVYNLNHFIVNNDSRSTFFAANTLGSLYNDLETLGINLGYRDGLVKSYFVTANGHEMGNVFTCFFSFYADFGFLGVAVFSLLMGWISQKAFETIKRRNTIVDFSFVIYLYISVNLIFSFFGPRFFQNVIQIKSILKFIWLYLLFFFLTESDVRLPYYQNGIAIYLGIR